MNINLAIRSIMVERKIKLIDIAKALNVSSSTISRQIGVDSKSPRIAVLERYAEQMGVKVSDIILKAESLGEVK